LRQHEQQLIEQRVDVCVVTFDAGPMAMAYVDSTNLSWPLLVDQDRSLYEAYGMNRGTWWNIYGPPAIGIYLRLLLRGRALKPPGSDVHQLGGDVLIDPKGLVRAHYVGVGPADRPAISTLLQPLRQAD
jgi:hypothetical protein